MPFTVRTNTRRPNISEVWCFLGPMHLPRPRASGIVGRHVFSGCESSERVAGSVCCRWRSAQECFPACQRCVSATKTKHNTHTHTVSSSPTLNSRTTITSHGKLLSKLHFWDKLEEISWLFKQLRFQPGVFIFFFCFMVQLEAIYSKSHGSLCVIWNLKKKRKKNPESKFNSPPGPGWGRTGKRDVVDVFLNCAWR